MPPSAAHAAIIRDLPAGYSATPEPWLAGSPHAIVRRGFVAEIRCTLADWCGCPECGGEPPRQVASGPVRLTFGGGATVSATNVTRACGACRGRGQAIGPEVVRRHPVERVILSDLKPTRDTWDSTYRWVIDIPAARADGDENNLCLLPEAVWKLLPGWNGKTLHARSYATREDAMFAASTALILWAKGTK